MPTLSLSPAAGESHATLTLSVPRIVPDDVLPAPAGVSLWVKAAAVFAALRFLGDLPGSVHDWCDWLSGWF